MCGVPLTDQVGVPHFCVREPPPEKILGEHVQVQQSLVPYCFLPLVEGIAQCLLTRPLPGHPRHGCDRPGGQDLSHGPPLGEWAAPFWTERRQRSLNPSPHSLCPYVLAQLPLGSEKWTMSFSSKFLFHPAGSKG
ncbi:hypothetical protein FKM82_017825 [Ascaphus truei]